LTGPTRLAVSDNILRVWSTWRGNSADMALYLIEDREPERVDMEGSVSCVEAALPLITLSYSDTFRIQAKGITIQASTEETNHWQSMFSVSSCIQLRCPTN
jgi:hypothetical protein